MFEIHFNKFELHFNSEKDSIKNLLRIINNSKLINFSSRLKYSLISEVSKLEESIDEKDFRLNVNKGEVSDGYHSFNELYHHRAILFSVICNTYPELAWKSLFHDDPDFPMYDGMFIVGIETPEGQATYHYNIDPYWNMFKVKELERAPKFDGHTPDEAIRRISLLSDIQELKCKECENNATIISDMVNDIIILD